MKTVNYVYRMTDAREEAAVPLHPIVALHLIPGGVEVRSLGGHGFAFYYNESDNDDEPVTSFPENENIVLNMRQGKVVLQLLTRELYAAEMQHLMADADVPDFKSDEDLGKYFYLQIQIANAS